MRHGYTRWMRRATGAGMLALLLVVAGCGSDNSAAPSSKYVGTYNGNVGLTAGSTGSLTVTVQSNGQASGSLVITSTAAAASRFRSAAVITVPLSVSLDPNTGAFNASGTYTNITGHAVSVIVSGTLPSQSPGSGFFTLQIGLDQFNGSIGLVVPTAAPTQPPANHTATPTRTLPSGTAAATATRTQPGSAPTATATATTAPQPSATPGGIVSSELLGIFTGTAANETVGVNETVRIHLELNGGSVLATDLTGNLFTSTSSITLMVLDPTHLSSIKTIGSIPGGYVETFQLSVVPGGTLGGIYSTVSLTNPTDTSNSFALVLHPE